MRVRPLTREEVRTIDQRAIAEFGMCGLVLMENAGRNAAMVIAQRWSAETSVCIVVGKGNNAGDGFVIARHLQLAGFDPTIVLTQDSALFSPDAAANYAIAAASKLQIQFIDPLADGDRLEAELSRHEVIVDALLGTGLKGAAREPVASACRWIQSAVRSRKQSDKQCAVVAIDVPSGLDCDLGTVTVGSDGVQNVVRADLTITFVAAKVGFGVAEAADYCGEVVVADIGAPAVLLAEYGAG